MKSQSRLQFFMAIIFAVGLLFLATSISHAATIASEDFDGYVLFPDYPIGDPTNLGVPLVIEGADSPLWMAARIGGNSAAHTPQNGGSATVASDVGVQRKGRPVTNETPAGRFADDAGLVMKVDLTAYENVVLDFDWRMHNEHNADRFKFAYFVGNEYLGNELGDPNGTYDWFADPNFGNGGMTWYTSNWTQPLSMGGQVNFDNPFTHATHSIPGGDIVYLLFWLDNSAGDGNFNLGKIDNVVLTGDLIVPEPGTFTLLALGIASLASLGIRRRGN